MRFTQILIRKQNINIKYETPSETGDFNKMTVNVKDEPAPSFREAIAALAPQMITLCEEDPKNKSRLEMRGITLTYHGDHDAQGVKISAVKKLKNSVGTVKLESPLRLAPSSDKENPKKDITPELSELITAVEKEAKKFLDGHKAQTKLKV